MQECVYEYSSVNQEYNSQLINHLNELQRQAANCQSNPNTQLQLILMQEMKRVKARSCSNRKPKYKELETKTIKNKILSLRKEVKDLRKVSVEVPRKRRISNNDAPLQFSVLKKEYQLQNKVYLEQKRRSQIQKRQILSIKNAIDQLNHKLESDSSQQTMQNDLTGEKRIKQLQKKKIKLLEVKKDTMATYEDQFKHRMGSMMNVDRSAFEREVLERKINQQLSYQRMLLSQMKGRGVRPSQVDESSDYQSVRAFNNMKRNIPQEYMNSIEEIPTRNQRTISRGSKQFRTLTSQNTPARTRQPNLGIILQKRRSFRTPVNLSPSKYQFNDLRNKTILSHSQKLNPQMIKPVLTRKDSLGIPQVSTLKINQSRNLDVSITSSMYNKVKGIELLNQSFVQLKTIKQNSRKPNASFHSKSSPKSRALNKSSLQKFQKQALETTKGDIGRETKFNNMKGVPFECNQQQQINSNQSFATKQLHRQIPPRYRIKALQLQQQQF